MQQRRQLNWFLDYIQISIIPSGREEILISRRNWTGPVMKMLSFYNNTSCAFKELIRLMALMNHLFYNRYITVKSFVFFAEYNYIVLNKFNFGILY